MIRIGPFVLTQVTQSGVESKHVAVTLPEQGQTSPPGSEFGKIFTRYLKETEREQPKSPDEGTLEEATLEEQKEPFDFSPTWVTLAFVGASPPKGEVAMVSEAMTLPKTESVSPVREVGDVAFAKTRELSEGGSAGGSMDALTEPLDPAPLQEQKSRFEADVPKRVEVASAGQKQAVFKTKSAAIERDLEAKGTVLAGRTNDVDSVPSPSGVEIKATSSPWQATARTVGAPVAEPEREISGAQVELTEATKPSAPKDALTVLDVEIEENWQPIAREEFVLQERPAQEPLVEETLRTPLTLPKSGVSPAEPLQQEVADVVSDEVRAQRGETSEAPVIQRTEAQPEAVDTLVPATKSQKTPLAKTEPDRAEKPQFKKASVRSDVPPRPSQTKGESLGPVAFQLQDSLVEGTEAEPQIKAVLDLQDREGLIPKLVQKLESLVQQERTEVRIQLKPEHLGELKIKLSLERGIMVAEFVVQNEAVREVIASQLPQLQTALQNQGSNTADVSVSIGLGHKGADEQREPRAKQPSESGNGRLQKGTALRSGQAYLGRSIWNQVDVRV